MATKEIRIPLADGKFIYIRGEEDFGWLVWLNSEHDFDGMCVARSRVGLGEAIDRTIVLFDEALATLRALRREVDPGVG